MVFYIEPQRNGLDRRVFRRMDNGGVEWSYYFDWDKDPKRARYFGFALRNPPEHCVEIHR